VLARYRDKLTYGLLKEITTKEWKVFFSQLQIYFLSYVVTNEVGGQT
jgi:hypothetical protein